MFTILLPICGWCFLWWIVLSADLYYPCESAIRISIEQRLPSSKLIKIRWAPSSSVDRSSPLRLTRNSFPLAAAARCCDAAVRRRRGKVADSCWLLLGQKGRRGATEGKAGNPWNATLCQISPQERQTLPWQRVHQFFQNFTEAIKYFGGKSVQLYLKFSLFLCNFPFRNTTFILISWMSVPVFVSILLKRSKPTKNTKISIQYSPLFNGKNKKKAENNKNTSLINDT